jgi:hypothetical protein
MFEPVVEDHVHKVAPTLTEPYVFDFHKTKLQWGKYLCYARAKYLNT